LRPYLCYGYRGLTFNADCGVEHFFSTPDRDGVWLVADVKIGPEKKKLWLCGCRGRYGSAGGLSSQLRCGTPPHRNLPLHSLINFSTHS